MKRFSAAAERNKAPIAEFLAEYLKLDAGTVLEIASGSGQHAVFWAEAMGHLNWLPSDPNPVSVASIEAYRQESGLNNVLPALTLDVLADRWPVSQKVDAMVCCNMIHISVPQTTDALFAGAARHLGPGRQLFLYGPFKRGGEHTAASNQTFDKWLKGQNGDWGVRDLEWVEQLAAGHGFAKVADVEMPANNALIVFAGGG